MSNELENLRRKVLELEEFKAKCLQENKELREREELFFKIFHASSYPTSIITVEEERLIDVNEAYVNLSGFKREELIGHTAKELGLLADRKNAELIAQKLKEGGNDHYFELDVRKKSGELRTVLFSADPITVNNESCMLTVEVDITERKREAETLKESEERYRALVENSLQGLSIVQDGRIVFCNNALATMTGFSVEELLAFPDSMVLVHPEDQAAVSRVRQDRMAGRPVPTRHEHRTVRKDGSVRWMDVQACIISYNGTPATQVVSMDITERKHAEEALKESTEYLNRIINCIGDHLFVLDDKHKFILVNDASCAFNGQRREELLGKSVFDYLPREQAVSIWKKDEAIFQTGRECVTEDSIADQQGKFRTVMTKKSLLTDKNGNKQIVCVLRDITEYKRLQAQFMQSQKMEAIGVLAGGVAHDFNNLLNVINGYCELLLEDLAADDPKRNDLEQISRAGQRAASLTSQLLAFSRKQILQPEILDLNSVITDMGAMLRRLIRESIDLVTITQPELGLINADPGQIQQILMNLAVNARDAMLQGGNLTIETANVNFDEEYVSDHPAVKAGPYVMLAISDNGMGMDDETKAHLFEPFFTTKKKGAGTGLGLSTVYGIVKQSHGFIWVYSEPGRGTTFKIYFPRAEGEISRFMEEGKLEQGARAVETVLVAEDESSVRALTARILRERGYTVVEASNANEALDVARKYAGKIHLILTDVVMPGMGGKDLVSQLKAIRPGIKALYVSGYTDNAIVHHGILDSSVDFLQKPFTVDGLARKVREVINSNI